MMRIFKREGSSLDSAGLQARREGRGRRLAGGLFAAFSVSCLLLSVLSLRAAEIRTLGGHVPKAVGRAQPAGLLAATNRLKLSLGLPLRNPEGVTNLLREIGNPGGPNFRRYITPEQFTEKFGPSAADYEAVAAFARASGWTITGRHSNRMLISVEATVADIERALHVRMKLYPHPTEAREFFAPDSEPTVDSNVPLLHISGLNDFTKPRPKSLRRQASPKAGVGAGNGYIGGDFRDAYAPGVSLTGAGQLVGLFELDGFYPADIASYARQAGMTEVPVTKVSVDGFDGIPASPSSPYCCGNEEVALDIEVTMAMAPGLSKILVYEGSYDTATTAGVDDVLNRMATDNLAKQLSCSWGFDIDLTTEQIFQEYALQGQTFFLASGDTGAFTPVVAQPSDNPYITVVGGTTLTVNSQNQWVSEATWNDLGLPGGSSGGISTIVPIPYWQQGISMSANGGSTLMRNVPDVSMVASNALAWADNGAYGAQPYEGTSIASPLWAAFTALANEQAAANGRPPLGFLNPTLYEIGKGPDYHQLFHDITVGTNPNTTDPTVFFPAVPGYDLVTGWGSPVGQSLIDALVAPPAELLVVSPLLGFTAFGPVGGPFNVGSETYGLTNAGSSSLGWSLANTSSWLNVSSAGGVLAGGLGTTAQVGLGAAATNFLIGSHSGNVVITDKGDGYSQVIQFNLMTGNGGFETGDFTDWTLVGDSTVNLADSLDNNYQNGSDQLPGVDDSLFVHSGIYGAFLGQNTTVGTLSQTLPTAAGERYTFSFWLANPATGTPNQFSASWNGTTLFDQTDMPQFGWTNLQYVVTATGSSTVVEFGFRNDINAFALDDISVTALPLPVPVIQSIRSAGGTVTVTWSATPGLAYQLQSTSDLVLPVWSSVGPALTATGTTLTETDPAGSAGERYYRVVLSQ